jgi:hypothetical protein
MHPVPILWLFSAMFGELCTHMSTDTFLPSNSPLS